MVTDSERCPGNVSAVERDKGKNGHGNNGKRER